MQKKTKIALIAVLAMICLCAAGYFVITSVMGNMHGDIAWKDHQLTYGGNAYHSVDDRFDVVANKEDTVIQLGWHYNFPFPNMHYHAFEKEAPLFIFCDNGEGLTTYNKGLYVKDGFDLNCALFTICDTDIEIALNAAMTRSDIDISRMDTADHRFFYLYLKDDARIRAGFSGPYLYNDAWYVTEDNEVYRLSDDLVLSLQENNILFN